MKLLLALICVLAYSYMFYVYRFFPSVFGHNENEPLNEAITADSFKKLTDEVNTKTLKAILIQLNSPQIVMCYCMNRCCTMYRYGVINNCIMIVFSCEKAKFSFKTWICYPCF